MRALLVLIFLSGCVSVSYPPEVYQEARLMCKPFGGMSDARIQVEANKYVIRTECLEGHVVKHTIQLD